MISPGPPVYAIMVSAKSLPVIVYEAFSLHALPSIDVLHFDAL